MKKTRGATQMPDDASLDNTTVAGVGLSQVPVPAKVKRRSRNADQGDKPVKKRKSATTVQQTVTPPEIPVGDASPALVDVMGMSSHEPEDHDVEDMEQVFAPPSSASRGRDGVPVLKQLWLKEGVTRYLQFFDFKAQIQRVHWVKEPSGKSKPVQCLGEGCPMCAALGSPQVWRGLPVLEIGDLTIVALWWEGPAEAATTVPEANTITDVVRAMVAAKDWASVVELAHTSLGYEYDIMDSADLADIVVLRESVDLGKAEIAAFLKARDAGLVRIEMGQRLTREQVLKQYPSIGRTARLVDTMGKGDRSKRLDALKQAFDKVDKDKGAR